MTDLLKTLDESKGGIPTTAGVKNKDRMIVLDLETSCAREFIDEVLISLVELRLGHIRTLTIIRSQRA